MNELAGREVDGRKAILPVRHKCPNIVDDESNTLQELRGMRADVILASHGFYFDLADKAARQKPGARDPLVDPGELGRHISEMEKGFEQALQAQEKQC